MSQDNSLNQKFRILVIDDDRFIQILLTKLLENQGFEVRLASNGEDGLQLAREYEPAVIICDWEMPGIKGIDVCRRVKADPILSVSFFILLTHRTTLSDRVEGLDAGADDFLTKPLEIAEFRARLRAGLRLYQTAQEVRQSAQQLQILTEELKFQKQLLEDELKGAADYVRSLLPTPLKEIVEVEYHFLPSIQLGGDCFDYFWLDPDYLAIYLLDVSGHGLKSALLSMTIQNIFRTRSLPDTNFYQPTLVLQALNETFQMNDLAQQYFTIWYGVYNCQKRQLVYASAGHPPAILLSPTQTGAQVQLLKTRGMPIGIFLDATFTSSRCDISKDSVLYIFSDGIYEFERPDGSIWNLNNFIDYLTTIPKPDTLESLVQQIKLKSESGFTDDCSLLQICFP